MTTPKRTVGYVKTTVELDGWPEQITITYNDQYAIRISYSDLRDLEYALQRAIQDISAHRKAKPGDPNYV